MWLDVRNNSVVYSDISFVVIPTIIKNIVEPIKVDNLIIFFEKASNPGIAEIIADVIEEYSSINDTVLIISKVLSL